MRPVAPEAPSSDDQGMFGDVVEQAMPRVAPCHDRHLASWMVFVVAVLVLAPAGSALAGEAGEQPGASDDITAVVLIAFVLIVAQALVILGLYRRLREAHAARARTSQSTDEGEKGRGQVVEGSHIMRLRNSDGAAPPPSQGPAERDNSGDELKRIFDLTPEILCVMDMQGRFVRTNPALSHLLGQSESVLIGTSALDRLHPEDREPTRQVLEAHRQGEGVSGLRSRLCAADGTYRLIEWNSAVDPAAGQIYAAGRDVTSLQRAQHQLEALNRRLESRIATRTAELDAANRELEAFAESIAHDLRAPMRAIGGFTQALREDCQEALSEIGRQHIERIALAAERMSEMTDCLLGLARTGRGPLQLEPLDLAALAREVVEGLRQGDPEREVEVEIEPGLHVTADRRLMRIALENLLSNAWKFTSARSPARIALRRAEAEGKVAYEVRDNGAGFDMAAADHLFTPFTRLHDVERFEGTGIGLATVQRIIRRHGGRIWARAEPERGASFFFTLSDEPAAASADVSDVATGGSESEAGP